MKLISTDLLRRGEGATGSAVPGTIYSQLAAATHRDKRPGARQGEECLLAGLLDSLMPTGPSTQERMPTCMLTPSGLPCQVGHARWRLVGAPSLPSLLSLPDPVAQPSRFLSMLALGTEVEVAFGSRLQVGCMATVIGNVGSCLIGKSRR